MVNKFKQSFRIAHFVFCVGVLVATAAQSDQDSKKSGDEELVKQLANPVASLISLRFQNNFDFNLGTGHGWRYTWISSR
jgi:hypothetical protein